MAISPQQLTIYLYSAHRAVTFAIAQLSCLLGQYLALYSALLSCLDYCIYSMVFFLVLMSMANKDSFIHSYSYARVGRTQHYCESYSGSLKLMIGLNVNEDCLLPAVNFSLLRGLVGGWSIYSPITVIRCRNVARGVKLLL